MIHQPLAGMQGTAEEISIHLNEFQRTKRRLNEILIRHCGQDLDTIERDTDRDRIMDPEEAVTYGLIDKVVASMPRVEPAS
jgi:ATP-dependent Clp protease protease subunit